MLCISWRKWCVVVVLLYYVQATAVQLCPKQESVDITNETMDGEGNIDYNGVRFNPSQYFKDGIVTRGCICFVRQCIYVCDAENITRVELTELYANVSDASGKNNSFQNLVTDDRYHLILEEPECEGYLLESTQEEVMITSTGELKWEDFLYSYSQFCMLPKDELGNFNALYCQPEISDWPHFMYAFGFLVSIPFLVVTFLVYAILPELQNLPGMSMMCYVAALAVSYLLLALARMDIYDYQSVMCRVTAYTLYFTLMASFFWLNIMSFDVYGTFDVSRGPTTERRKFLNYSLYAWGVPLLFLAVVLLFDHTELISYDLRPNIGEEGCFLKEVKLTQFLYLYLPLLLLVTANIYFFSATAIRIYRAEKAHIILMKGNSRHRTGKFEKDRNRFVLYLRLFTIMGVTWSLEIISWLVTDSNTPSPSWVVYVLDVSNCLAGIVIFFLFVWKIRVKELLLQRFVRKENISKDGCTGFTRSSTQSGALTNMGPSNQCV